MIGAFVRKVSRVSSARRPSELA